MSQKFWLPALLAALLLWFPLIGSYRLFNPDEGRYAEIPREMVASGDWVTPRLNDLKYFEKPPLQYWATAVGYEFFGEHEWTARLWVALTRISRPAAHRVGGHPPVRRAAPARWRRWCRAARCCIWGWRASRRSTWV